MLADSSSVHRNKELMEREQLITSSNGPRSDNVSITALPMMDKQRSEVDKEEREENQRRGMSIHKKQDLLVISRCVVFFCE